MWAIRSRPDQPWAPSTGTRELLVGQAGERLERTPGVTFLFEELERIEVHAGIVGDAPVQTATGLAVLAEDPAQDARTARRASRTRRRTG